MSKEDDEEVELPEVVKELDENQKQALVNLIDSKTQKEKEGEK